MKVLGHPLARLLLVLIALLSSVGIASGEVAAFTYDDGGNFEEATTGALSSSFVEFQVRSVPNEVEPVAARGAGLRLAPDFVAPQSTRGGLSGNPHGLGVSDTPSRVSGPWTDADLACGAVGKPPRSLGSPELHHADQMPGAGIHEVDPITDRLPGNHPNKWNQGVTDEMRRSDRELHWWYRSQEMGGRDVLGEGDFYG